MLRCPVCGSEYADFSVLGGYSTLIYRTIVDEVRPLENNLTTELDVLGNVAGIGPSTEYWTRKTIEEMDVDAIQRAMLEAWDAREKLRDRLAAAWDECQRLERAT